MYKAPVRKTLLIIEDDLEILDILELIFPPEGYQVITSENGNETHDLRLIAPNLITLDIRLTTGGKEDADICLRLKSRYYPAHPYNPTFGRNGYPGLVGRMRGK